MYFGLHKWKEDSANRPAVLQELIDAALAQIGSRQLTFMPGDTMIFGYGDDRREIGLIATNGRVEVVADSPLLPDDVRAMLTPDWNVDEDTARLLDKARTRVFGDLYLIKRYGDPAKLPI